VRVMELRYLITAASRAEPALWCLSLPLGEGGALQGRRMRVFISVNAKSYFQSAISIFPKLPHTLTT
jgi:hypothetical protein